MKKLFFSLTLIFSILIPLFVGAMANPASVNCVEKGGRLTITDNSYGTCKFPDGTQCEEWDYFRDECKPGQYKDWYAEAPKYHDLFINLLKSGWVSEKNSIELGLWDDYPWTARESAKYFYVRIDVGDSRDSRIKDLANMVLVVEGALEEIVPVSHSTHGYASQAMEFYVPLPAKIDTLKFTVKSLEVVEEKKLENNSLTVSLSEVAVAGKEASPLKDRKMLISSILGIIIFSCGFLLLFRKR